MNESCFIFRLFCIDQKFSFTRSKAMLYLVYVVLFFVGNAVIYGEDPEVNMNVPQMLQYWGYPVEEHQVTTQDGYILTIHRIPHGKNEEPSISPKPVVFLQHCLLCSSSDWLSNLPNESLGYILADKGFDVWLGNNRGNTYGLKHATLTPNLSQFWNFSWDEFALKDLPAMINHVLNDTGMDTLSYVGHSQGTLIGFAGFSDNQELGSKINIFIAMGPVSTLKYITSPIKYLAPIAKDVELACQWFVNCGYDFLPSDAFMKFLGLFFCGKDIEEIICENAIFLLCGYDYAQLNRTRLPVYIAHTPAGTSVKNIIQYGQMVNSGKCQRFDYYDEEKNRAVYNQTEPPVFNMSKVNVPTVLYYASKDSLADPTDVKNLIKLLPNVVNYTMIEDWEHLDFIWGLDAARLVYKPTIEYLKKFASVERRKIEV